MPPILTNKVDLTAKPSNKKIVFDDDGEILSTEAATTKKTKQKKHMKHADQEDVKTEDDEGVELEDVGDDNEEDYFAKRDRQRLEQKQKSSKNNEDHKKWFNVYPQFPSSEEDVLDMKESEQMELYNLCKSSFDAEMPTFTKRNTSDARWLQTALHKGTAKDRANAGALLVTSNSLGNLEALTTLIGFTKLSNKSSSDVIGILTDLFKEVLLPPHRKLISLQMRAVDWKLVRKDTNLTKEQQRRIFAFWHFENELKEQYFEFLKNLQQGIQTGQENNKNASIVSAAQLLAFAPEKEQMLLSMLINKLGDPIAKIASKALHHLSEVAHKHPNMCGVIVAEAEKFLFRNNISERAQHFALCFLASVAPSGRPDVCSKLVHICFSLFKVLVQKGAVNNRAMQAILRCLQKAILEAQPPKGETEILNKEMQDTIYRLVHMGDIRISVQTLGLLLQLVTVKTEKSDRFYNALYRKLLDMELGTIGVKTAAQLLHIVHRAIHIDANIQRALAFIKRLLQVSLDMPQHMAAGCLIVIHKLLRSRKELAASVGNGAVSANGDRIEVLPKVTALDEELEKFDSDGEEKYDDIQADDESKTTEISDSKLKKESKPRVVSSWHHAKVGANLDDKKVRDIGANKYDPFHRVPTFAGAEFAHWNELLLLSRHVHPTVQVFASNIINQKRIDYYGDPLRDFGLPHFLERFAFKNPKKLDTQKAEAPIIAHKRYSSFGTRGKPVKSLTKANCTEDEMFILNFLEEKRKQSAAVKKYKKATEEEDEDNLGLKEGEINDDEFEQYLDGFFGKKAKAASDAEADAEDDDVEEFDFLKELGGELKDDTKQTKKKKHALEDDQDDVEDIDADWGDDEVGDDDFADANSDISEDEEGSIDNDDDDDDDDGGSISLDENMEDENSDEDESEQDSSMNENDSDEEDDMAPPKSKKSRPGKEMSFAKKLKHSDDMSSLFAAADDFAELLEETGKSRGQGTINAVYNKDKSSDKQMKWEEKRRSNTKTYTKKKAGRFGGSGAAKGGSGGSGKVYGKKRKH